MSFGCQVQRLAICAGLHCTAWTSQDRLRGAFARCREALLTTPRKGRRDAEQAPLSRRGQAFFPIGKGEPPSGRGANVGSNGLMS